MPTEYFREKVVTSNIPKHCIKGPMLTVSAKLLSLESDLRETPPLASAKGDVEKVLVQALLHLRTRWQEVESGAEMTRAKEKAYPVFIRFEAIVRVGLVKTELWRNIELVNNLQGRVPMLMWWKVKGGLEYVYEQVSRGCISGHHLKESLGERPTWEKGQWARKEELESHRMLKALQKRLKQLLKSCIGTMTVIEPIAVMGQVDLTFGVEIEQTGERSSKRWTSQWTILKATALVTGSKEVTASAEPSASIPDWAYDERSDRLALHPRHENDSEGSYRFPSVVSEFRVNDGWKQETIETWRQELQKLKVWLDIASRSSHPSNILQCQGRPLPTSRRSENNPQPDYRKASTANLICMSLTPIEHYLAESMRILNDTATIEEGQWCPRSFRSKSSSSDSIIPDVAYQES